MEPWRTTLLGIVTREGTLSLGRESRSSESSALTIWKLGVSSSSLVITDNVWNIRRQKWWTKGSFVQDIPQNGQHHQWLSPAGPNGYPIPDIFFISDPNQFSFENHQLSGNLNLPATQFVFDNRPKPARYWKEKPTRWALVTRLIQVRPCLPASLCHHYSSPTSPFSWGGKGAKLHPSSLLTRSLLQAVIAISKMFINSCSIQNLRDQHSLKTKAKPQSI